MSRKEYIDELYRRLSRMPEADRREAVGYYEEYFDEAGPENEQDVINNFGSPAQVARQILADYAVKESVAKPQSPRKGLWAILLVLLAICAAPIALPVAIVAVTLIFVAIVLVVVFIFVGVVIVGAMGVAGIAGLISAVAVITLSPATGIFCLGIGIAFIGICLLCGICVSIGLTRGMPYVVRGINDGLNRIQKRGNR